MRAIEVKDFMTNDQHNKYVAYAFFAYAGFQVLILLMMAAMFSMMFFIPPTPGDPGPPKAFFAMMIGFMSIFYLAFTVPSVVAGYGVLKRKSWARIASIVAAVVSGMSVPFGTAACAYALWIFLGENWNEIYPASAPPKPADPVQLNDVGDSRWSGSYQTDEDGQVVYSPVEPPDWR